MTLTPELLDLMQHNSK